MTAMALLIEYPLLAAAIGLVLVALGRLRHRRTAAGVGVLWLVYSAYELGMQRRWLCSGECNIRVDLLFIYPVLMIGVVVAGIGLIRGPGGPRSPGRR